MKSVLNLHRFLRFYFSVFSVVLVSIEKIYQTLVRVFHHMSKHLEVRQKYSATRHIFNSLLGVWKCDETLSLVFDILLTECLHTKVKCKFDIVKVKSTQVLFIVKTFMFKALSPGQTRMRVDSHESFRQLSSNIVDSVQTRTRVVESPSRVTTNERKLSSTLMKNLSTFKVNESAQESMRVYESFRPNESESLNSHHRLARALQVNAARIAILA